MSDKLYIVCPFSQLESYLITCLKHSPFFMSGVLGRLNTENTEQAMDIFNLTMKQAINEVIFVNDIEINF